MKKFAFGLLITAFLCFGGLTSLASATPGSSAPGPSMPAAPPPGAHPLTEIYEPENTVFTVSYGGCTEQAEYGNIFGAAWAKIYNPTAGCDGSVTVEGYANGTYSEGNTALSYGPGSGWVQSTDYNTNIVGAYFDECSTSGFCPFPTFYTPL